MNLTFSPPSVLIEPEFWSKLYTRKLDLYKLDINDQPLQIFYSMFGCFCLSSKSFDTLSVTDEKLFMAPGVLRNVNTMNEFQNLPKNQFLSSIAEVILKAITSGDAIRNPSLLFSFVLLTYADLKSYRFTYWYGAPVLVPIIPFRTLTDKSYSYLKSENSQIALCIYRKLSKYLSSRSNQSNQLVFMLINSNENDFNLVSLDQGWDFRYQNNSYIIIIIDSFSKSSTTATANSQTSSLNWTIRNLLALLAYHTPADFIGTSEKSMNQNIACNLISLKGSVLKHLLTASYETSVENMTNEEILNTDESICFSVDLGLDYYNRYSTSPHSASTKSSETPTLPLLPRVVGWELNEKNKPGPRTANMSSTLDHRTMIGQSVDLNVSLMKWRVWPSLDTHKLASTKVLLIGAGTLGCAVARTLLGWGIRHITLVDNGIVSYSNPSRQCLFEYEDCVNRKPKAQAARDSLLRIFPDLKVTAVMMSVPMPGHKFTVKLNSNILNKTNTTDIVSNTIDTVTDLNVNNLIKETSSNTNTNATLNDMSSYEFEEELNVLELDKLISTHDVTFTLTDSRESRWLPTVICQARQKLLINVALGFDSYLVMRHGLTSIHSSLLESENNNSNNKNNNNTDNTKTENEINEPTVLSSSTRSSIESEASSTLGCYFCSDIVAAMNSQRDRTLDQQCTVTRPGLSFIAAGLAVEMMVSLIQSTLPWYVHPANTHFQNKASTATVTMQKSSNEDMENDNDNDIIPIPHQIRGTLKQFNQIDITTPAFHCCTACSRPIVDAYINSPCLFVKNACSDDGNKYLETLSGVTAMMSNIDLSGCDYDYDDEDD